jgi:hypothetical protein
MIQTDLYVVGRRFMAPSQYPQSSTLTQPTRILIAGRGAPEQVKPDDIEAVERKVAIGTQENKFLRANAGLNSSPQRKFGAIGIAGEFSTGSKPTMQF